MTNRKTNKWTENLEDAFDNAKSGRAGELAVIQHLKASGCANIIDHEHDKEIQMEGIDISYDDPWGCPVSIQVKENYDIQEAVVPGAPTPRTFCVEIDNNPKKHICSVLADKMIHINIPNQSYVIYNTYFMVLEVLEHDSRAGGYTGDYLGSEFYYQGVRLVRVQDDKFPWFQRGILRTPE